MTSGRPGNRRERLARIGSWSLTLATLAVLFLWHDTFTSLLAARPPAVALKELRIAAPQNPAAPDPVVIGRNELGQPQAIGAAELEHIRLDWTREGWIFRNIAKSRRLTLTYRKSGEDRDVDSARWPLTRPVQVEIAGETGSIVVGLTPLDGKLSLTMREVARGGPEAAYEIRLAKPVAMTQSSDEASVSPDCGGDSIWAQRWLVDWNRETRAFFGFDREVAIALLGGTLTCSQDLEPLRLALPGVPEEAFALYVSGGALYLGLGPSRNEAARQIARSAIVISDGAAHALASVPHRKDDPVLGALVAVTAGRASYAVGDAPGGGLALVPVSNNPWFWTQTEGGESAVPPQKPGVIFGPSEFRRDVNRSLLWNYARTHGALQAAVAFLTFLGGLTLFAAFGERGGWLKALASSGLAALAAGGAVFVINLDGAAFGEIGYPAALLMVLGLWSLAALGVVLACRGAWLGPAFWLLVTALAALGNLVIAQLAFGGDGERWVGFYARALPPLALVAAAVAISSAVPRTRWLDLFAMLAGAGRGWIYAAARMAPFAILLFMIVFWLAVGKEEGVEGLFQPSEFVKLGMVLLVAMAIVGAYKNTVIEADSETRLLRVFWSFLGVVILLLVFCLAPIARHDYSPALIMGVTAVVLFSAGAIVGAVNQMGLMAAALSKRHPFEHELNGLPPISMRRQLALWLGGLPLWTRLGLIARAFSRWIVVWIGLFALLIGAGATWVVSRELGRSDAIARADEGRGASQFSGIYDRVMSYLDLHLDREGLVTINYPDEGRQVRLSREAIAAAPCDAPWPAGSGLSTMRVLAGKILADCPSGSESESAPVGLPNDPMLLRIPVVQNDFIGSFVIGRFGVATASLMIALQLAIVGLCCCVAVQTYRWRTGYELDRARRHLLALAALGAGVLFALQWGLSWSNVFGLLPVVGQPMTFVASAGSHVVMMAAPLIVLVLVAIRSDADVYGALETMEPPPVPRTDNLLARAVRPVLRFFDLD